MTNPPQKLPMQSPDLTDIEKMTGETRDLVADNIAQLKALFPEVMTEGKINFDTLQELLGAEVEKNEEHYNFTWHGKRAALRFALKQSTGTLRPVKGESVDWDNTQNVFIEGDNLEVLKLLQKSYFGKVKMIYIDPPYNTGNDFVYADNMKDPLNHYFDTTGQLDEEGYKTSTTADSNKAGRFHTNWLNMMYPRLNLARKLMRDDGVIFISIDDNEQTNLKKLCDEVFGEENFVELFIWRKKSGGGQQDDYVVTEHDYILCYAKSKYKFKLKEKTASPRTSGYNFRDEVKNKNYKRVKLAKWGSAALREDRPTMYDYPELIDPDGERSLPVAPDGRQGRWRYGRQSVIQMLEDDNIDWDKVSGKWIPYEKDYQPTEDDFAILKERSIFYDLVENGEGSNELKNLFGVKDVFSNPKPSDLIAHLIYLSVNPEENQIVLDFFAGSGSTGSAVYNYNNLLGADVNYILVQLPEKIEKTKKEQRTALDFCNSNNLVPNIAEIAKERIRRAGKKIKAAGGLAHNPDLGFKVFRLDSSNLNLWDPYPDHEDLQPNLTDAVDYIKDDRKEDDLLFELLLKCGLDLAVPIETRTVAGNKQIYSIGLGKLVVCLDTDITTGVAEAIAELNAELTPENGMRVILRDEGFKDDCAKTNSIITLKSRGITDVKSL